VLGARNGDFFEVILAGLVLVEVLLEAEGPVARGSSISWLPWSRRRIS
jgi:hypothetical protein